MRRGEAGIVVHNKRMHLTGYSGLRPLAPAGDARRYAPVVGDK